MSRDYKSRKPSASRNAKYILMLGVFIGYTLGIISAIGIWFYLEQVPSPFLTDPQISSYEGVDREESDKQPVTKELQADNSDQTDQNPHFGFYDTLLKDDASDVMYDLPEDSEKQRAAEKPKLTPPSISITPRPEVSAQERTVQQSDQAKSTYYLQVGSFRSSADADNLKARLALLGIIASVQSADLSDKGIWYRVRVGPFTQKNRVDGMHQTLQENGIDAQFIKIQ